MGGLHMTEVITVYLDSFRKYRNPQEYYSCPRATCGDLVEEGHGFLIQKLLKRYALEYSVEDTSVHVRVLRGDTLCFVEMPLSSWIAPPSKEVPAGLAAYHQRQKL